MSERCPLLYAKALDNHHHNCPRNYRPGFQNGQLTSHPQDRPSQLQADRRLPPPNTYPQHPILLFSGDYAMHSILLLPPSSDILSSLLCHARTVRAATAHISPKDIVEHAITRSKSLRHISNGSSGGIWMLEKDREEVLACLVLEMEGSWELLGVGTDKSQGEVFLRHSYGFGPNNEVESGCMGPLEWMTRPGAEARGTNHNIIAGSQGERQKIMRIQSQQLDWTTLRRIKALNKWKGLWARMCHVPR